jgi:hypothetical protein
MPENARPVGRAFLSHSWDDKAFARRVARRLSHRGVPVWVDDNEMQVGERLSERLQAEILQSSHLLVLLTASAIKSKWVAQEIEVAKSQPKSIRIIPLIAQAGLKTDLLDIALGTSIAEPWTFEERLDAVAGAILGRKPSVERDVALLKRDLAEIAGQTPELRGIIDQLGRQGRITQPQQASIVVDEPLRHPAETALIVLHESVDVNVRPLVALVAASCFARLGVGYEVLRRQIMVEPAGSVHLAGTFNLLGGYIERQNDLEGVCRLFDLAPTPLDTAFERFVAKNLDRFTQSQREWAVRYVMMPERGPGGGSGQAAFELFWHLPDNHALRELWLSWVADFKFGGKADRQDTESVYTFFNRMNEAASNRRTQFDDVVAGFRRTLRRLARSRDPHEVCGAVFQLQAAGDTRYVGRRDLAVEFGDAVRSLEWKSFAYRDAFTRPILDLARAIADDEPFDSDTFEKLSDIVYADYPG